MDDRSSQFGLARSAFEDYLRRLRSGEQVARERFLDAQPDPIRGEVKNLIDDYHVLRQSAGSAHAGLTPERTLGDFRLLQEIGRGGMGSVWEAEQISLHRRVALKLLHPHLSLSGTALRRFQVEAQAAGRLTHPNIVAVYEVGDVDGVHYIAQELVPGGFTLADRFAELRDEPETDRDAYRSIAEMFVAIADALHSAHRAGILHRDVKPGNVLLTSDGRPKLADFGLAKIQDELGLSRSGDLIGTPFYMSPEQAASKRIGLDARSDVFSLGASFYEALTLTRPFQGESSREVVERILLDDPIDPRRLRSKVPRDLAVICFKALEKKRERRYVSATEFAADLKRWLANESIEARPPSSLGRALRWTRRHPVISTSGAVAAFALIALTLALWQTRSAMLRAQRAEAETSRALKMLPGVLSLLDPQSPDASTPERAAEIGRILNEVLAIHANDADKRADWLLSVGKALNEIDRLDAAKTILSAGYEAARTAFGADDARTVRLLAELLLTYARSEDYEAIKPRRDDMLALEARVNRSVSTTGTADSLEVQTTVFVLETLGNAYLAIRDHDAAERSFARLLELCRLNFNETDPRTLSARLGRVIVLNRQGKRDDAKRELEPLIGDCVKVLGTSHPTTLRARWRAAINLLDTSHPTEAEKIYKEIVPLMIKRLGADHIDTLKAREGLVLSMSRLGECGELLPLATALYDDMVHVLGPDHSTSVIGLRILAAEYRNAGNFARAEQLYQSAYDRALAKHGDSDQITVDARGDLIGFFHDRAAFARARELARAHFDVAKRTHPNDELRLLGEEASMQRLAVLAGDCGAPLTRLRAIVAQVRAEYALQPDVILGIGGQLGEALRSCGDLDGAEPYYRADLDLVLSQAPIDPNHLAWAQTELAGLLIDKGRIEEARSLLDAARTQEPLSCQARYAIERELGHLKPK